MDRHLCILSSQLVPYQEYTCAVLAASVQLWPIQVEKLAAKHLLKSNGPAHNTNIMALLSSTYTLRALDEAAHHPYASFRGPCSFQNLILPSIAPNGKLQYSMKTPRMKGGKSSSNMTLDWHVTSTEFILFAVSQGVMVDHMPSLRLMSGLAVT